MHLEDKSQVLSPKEQEELLRFLTQDLRVSEELRFLGKIIVRSDEDKRYLGYWNYRPSFSSKASSKDAIVITHLSAIIVLNSYYLKTLDEMKKVLAHEYGHHWTLCYLALRWGFDLRADRLPENYYGLRGLDPVVYQVDYRNGWEWCDREVLAEDYRVCFAPPAQGQDHSMVPPLTAPSAGVKRWIANLAPPPLESQGGTGDLDGEPDSEPDGGGELSERQGLGGANPFQPLSGPIDRPEHFWGRQREVNAVFDCLKAGSSVELLGERQIGKSSLLWQIKHLVETEARLARQPPYINLQEVENERDFYEVFCDHLKIPTCWDQSFVRAVKQRQLLLLLDEVEKLAEPRFSRNIPDRLCSLVQAKNRPLRLVIAARTPLSELFPDDPEHKSTSPLHNHCYQIEVGGWDLQGTQEFISARLGQTQVQFTEAEVEGLWQETLGHPHRLMKACFERFNHYANFL